MGFVLKRSTPSLMAGSLFGLSLLFVSIKIMTYHKWGLYVAFILMLLLDAFFSYRFLTSHALFPSGIMLLITTLTLLLSLMQLKKSRSGA